MSENLEARVWEALKGVTFPGMSRDIVSFGFVPELTVQSGRAVVRLRIQTRNQGAAEEVRERARDAVGRVDGVSDVEIVAEFSAPPSPQESAQRAIARDPRLIPEVDHVVAVASGKGGVGKSTVAVNLAVSLAQAGHSVGLLDADIYGPSVPMMTGLAGEHPRVGEGGQLLVPFERHGIKIFSLGFILDSDTPVIWRGPMVMKAIEQLLGDVDWGALDFMVIDLPPGTGDAQLTLCQKVPLSGAVIVSTPQDVALIDARKGLAMFEKVNVPVLGVIENMSSFVCPHCGESTDIFKRGGAERTASELGCVFLGSVPLDPAITRGGDAGAPVVLEEGAHREAFARIAAAVAEAATRDKPSLSIQ